MGQREVHQEPGHFTLKPFDPEELELRLRALLRRAYRDRPHITGEEATAEGESDATS